MSGFSEVVIDASALLAPAYGGLLALLGASVIGIVMLSPAPRRIRFWIAVRRFRRFGGPGQPAWRHRSAARA